jgi:hypothetical protein
MESKKRKGGLSPPAVISLTDHDDNQDTPTKNPRHSENPPSSYPKSVHPSQKHY